MSQDNTNEFVPIRLRRPTVITQAVVDAERDRIMNRLRNPPSINPHQVEAERNRIRGRIEDYNRETHNNRIGMSTPAVLIDDERAAVASDRLQVFRIVGSLLGIANRILGSVVDSFEDTLIGRRTTNRIGDTSNPFVEFGYLGDVAPNQQQQMIDAEMDDVIEQFHQDQMEEETRRRDETVVRYSDDPATQADVHMVLLLQPDLSGDRLRAAVEYVQQLREQDRIAQQRRQEEEAERERIRLESITRQAAEEQARRIESARRIQEEARQRETQINSRNRLRINRIRETETTRDARMAEAERRRTELIVFAQNPNLSGEALQEAVRQRQADTRAQNEIILARMRANRNSGV